MCGIAGALSFADVESADLVAPVREMVARMARRGPDDEGVWTDEARCALGFRRLSILDLTDTGHQPMVTPDGRHALVFNGEIYNYREVRAELVERGHVLHSSGDTETLLHALAEWGTAALARLNGMFAFAWYDRREQRIVLGRDHAGIKPLHYAIGRRGVVFGSQYADVLRHPWVRTAPSRDGLGLYLRLGFVPAPYGLHETTGQVEAGQWVQIDARGTVRRRRFFELPVGREPELAGDAAIDAFDEAFARAVKRHLISDVPVGVLLSGGIDSPLVAAEARRHHTGTLQAFTIGVPTARFDEVADAGRYASELGLEHVVEPITAEGALAMVDDVVAASSEPTGDYSMFPTLLVSRLARRHVKVVLSGDGGDELYWGYVRRFAPAIEQARYFRYPQPVRFAAAVGRRLFDVGTATRDAITFSSLGDLYLRKHSLLREADLAAVFPEPPELPRAFRAFEYTGTDATGAAQWARWNEFRIHLARVLQKVDRASMHHSIEVRVPLLDREVIDVAWRTDWRSCLDLETRVGKRVLRGALARRVRHQTAAKKGFAVPMYDWLVKPLLPLVRETLFARRDVLGIHVRPGAIEELHGRLAAGDRARVWGLWTLLSLALWERAYGSAA